VLSYLYIGLATWNVTEIIRDKEKVQKTQEEVLPTVDGVRQEATSLHFAPADCPLPSCLNPLPAGMISG
jgi:hypothetical protein